MKGLKCFTAVVMDSASTSQGSQVTWCFHSLALKKPARNNWWSHLMYKVTPSPCMVTEPSVTIHKASEGQGRTIDLWLERACWPAWNRRLRSSFHSSWSEDCSPAIACSRESINWEQWGRARLRTTFSLKGSRILGVEQGWFQWGVKESILI